ncbi:tRNA (adenosine(37)-N6)-dimethylallyltransferase MiaA, partial [Acinetobacter baumannii]
FQAVAALQHALSIRDVEAIPVLAGPTGSGKTFLALRLGEEVPVEVVSADATLVYRGLDIGTDKPTPEERARVPHHLVDVLEPHEAMSVA